MSLYLGRVLDVHGCAIVGPGGFLRRRFLSCCVEFLRKTGWRRRFLCVFFGHVPYEGR